MPKNVTVIGAGLAGSEATWQLAKRGIHVDLYEMRPKKETPAHETGEFAELVCTNSMRSNQLSNAVGLLKEEMRHMDSLIMKAADKTQVPAGGALAVDRDSFSKYVTDTLRSLDNVTVHEEEITEIPEDGITVIATGPLTSDALAEKIQEFSGTDSLHFFDAAAPIVAADSIDMDIVYKKSRYDRGEAAYLNCPMTKEQYEKFAHELINASYRNEQNEHFQDLESLRIRAFVHRTSSEFENQQCYTLKQLHYLDVIELRHMESHQYEDLPNPQALVDQTTLF